MTTINDPLISENRRVRTRRLSDIAARCWSVFVYTPKQLFGMLYDPQNPNKLSSSRVLLFVLMAVGVQMFEHEIRLGPGTPAIGNAVWTAWWAATGFLAGCCFVPKAVESYFSPGAAGAAAASAIGAALRDPSTALLAQLKHDPGA